MYEISPISVFDEDNMLWETKIGLGAAFGRPLYFSAWGETEKESRDRATSFIEMMNRQD